MIEQERSEIAAENETGKKIAVCDNGKIVQDKRRSSSIKIVMTAIVTAFTCTGGLFRIPTPIVAITMQTFFACLAGLILGAKLGALSQAVYVLLGLIGVPIFSEGGGFGYVFKPSFGFLLGFILCAFITGLAKNFLLKTKNYSSFKSHLMVFLACVLGMVGLYLIGVPYMALILRLYLNRSAAVVLSASVSMGLFFLCDLVTIIILTVIVTILYKRLPSLFEQLK